jgi:hypothetical protein
VKFQRYFTEEQVTDKTSFIIKGTGFLLFTLFFLTSVAWGQDNQLNLISTAERSDGKGYVVRYHMDQKIDSFRVYQPTTDLIQMTLYGERVDTTGVTDAASLVNAINDAQAPTISASLTGDNLRLIDNRGSG